VRGKETFNWEKEKEVGRGERDSCSGSS